MAGIPATSQPLRLSDFHAISSTTGNPGWGAVQYSAGWDESSGMGSCLNCGKGGRKAFLEHVRFSSIPKVLTFHSPN
jgi:hypothetical protein